MRREWWRTFFRPSTFPIDRLVPPERTAEELRVLERLLPPPPARVLDVACGTGRHAVPLARLGYRVTGADLSASYLRLARQRARRARVKADFVRRDMRRLRLDGRFDAVLNLWTSLGYFPSPAQDVAALREMRRTLRPGGRLILELVNGDFVRRHLLRRNWSEADGGWMLEESEWRGGPDPGVFTTWTFVRSDGRSASGPSFVRHYDASRLAKTLARAGFRGARIGPGLLEPGATPAARKRLLAICVQETT